MLTKAQGTHLDKAVANTQNQMKASLVLRQNRRRRVLDGVLGGGLVEAFRTQP